MTEKKNVDIIANIKAQGVPEHECWRLLSLVTGKTRIDLQLNSNYTFSDNEENMLQEFIKQIINQKKPIQYIEKSVDFCGLKFRVCPPILIPRPETEEWVTWLIEQLLQTNKEPLELLDIGTGSGCIGLSIAYHCPWINVTAIDTNPKALSLAQENQQLLGIKNINFIQSSFYNSLTNRIFDLIVSNPPYITEVEYKTLDPRVTLWEDKNALVTSDNGIYSYSEIFKGALTHLKKKTKKNNLPLAIVVELGTEVDRVVHCFKQITGKKYTVLKDLEGKSRWLAGAI